jgi:hypothetical protein
MSNFSESCSHLPYHLQTSRSTRLRQRSLRVSLLPPESEDVSVQSVDEEDLPDDQRAFTPSPPPPSPSVSDDVTADESGDSSSDNSTYQHTSRRPRKSLTSRRGSNNPTRATKSPAKKSRKKRRGQSTRKKGHSTIHPAPEEILQGLGPIPTPRAESQSNETEPRIYASIVNNGSHKKRKPGSLFWQYIHGLKSDIQPASYSLEGIPILKKRPNAKDGFRFIGCRICNQPLPGQKQSS